MSCCCCQTGTLKHRGQMRSSGGEAAAEGGGAVDSDAVNLAKLIKQYEDSCSMEVSQSSAGMYISEVGR